MTEFVEFFGGFGIYIIIIIIVVIFILLAWLFEFLNKKKVSKFFEKIAEGIKDFFT